MVAFVVSENNRLTMVWEACSGRASVSCYFPNTGLQGTLNQLYLNSCSTLQSSFGLIVQSIVGRDHRLNGHEFGQTPGDGEG